MAKLNPAKFAREVQAESRKVTWPSGRETAMTTLMVIIMTGVLGLFFFGVDSVFGWIMKQLLTLV